MGWVGGGGGGGRGVEAVHGSKVKMDRVSASKKKEQDKETESLKERKRTDKNVSGCRIPHH